MVFVAVMRVIRSAVSSVDCLLTLTVRMFQTSVLDLKKSFEMAGHMSARTLLLS